jgi:hypothetical protein
MASFSTINDVTKPVDFSNVIPQGINNAATSKNQREAMKAIGAMVSNSASSVPEDTEMEIDKAIQESMPWTEVKNKKDGKIEEPECADSTMKKVRVTLTIRSSKNNDFNPAKLHIDTLHELHKFDESLIVFNTTGDNKVNIESSISESRYKELFKPMRTKTANSLLVSRTTSI